MSTRAERKFGVTADSGAALRLLYACLSPLEAEELGPYEDFLESFPKTSMHGLRCAHVLQFLRRALEVPDSKHMLLVVLIDEGNAAKEAFPPAYGRPPEVSSLISHKLWTHCALALPASRMPVQAQVQQHCFHIYGIAA